MGCPVGWPLDSRGLPMDYPWVAIGLTAGYPPDAHGMPMNCK